MMQQCIPTGQADHFAGVGKMVMSGGVAPENLPAAEDVKKVERRLTSSEKKAVQKPAGLGQKMQGEEK